MTTTRPSRKKTASARRKKKTKGKGWLARVQHLLFGSRYKQVFWVAAGCIILFYVFLFYTFLIIPSSVRSRWLALYGDISYPAGYSIHGIDVSHHQGRIDWRRVAEAKVNDKPVVFVIIKATEGKSLLDENFNDNFYQAREYGLVRGAYHYFSPTVKGSTQAQYYLHQVHLDEGDLPPVLDVEERGHLTREQLQHEVLEWLRMVEECYNVPPIIYTGLKFKEANLSTPDFDRYPFWIAHYYVKEVGYKGEWRFWQHTDLGQVDGIRGPVDLNIYNGSMYDLRHLTIGKGEEPQENEEPGDM